MMSLNVRSLISNIQRRPAIWDKRTQLYANRFHVDRAWMEISLKMGVPASVLKRKWKYLRDQFCVEAGKVAAPRSASEGPYEPKWPYYEYLMYLKDVVKPRDVSSNPKARPYEIEDPEELVTPDLDDSRHSNNSQPSSPIDIKPSIHMESTGLEGCESNSFICADSVPSISIDSLPSISVAPKTSISTEPQPSIPTDNQPSTSCQQQTPAATSSSAASSPGYVPPPKRSKRKRKAGNHDAILEMEKKKTDILLQIMNSRRQRDEDGDLLFLKSLLPHIRKIPSNRQLRFRNKLSELVQSFAYGDMSEEPPVPEVIVKIEK